MFVRNMKVTRNCGLLPYLTWKGKSRP
uniref:Uncharacterized protein n=1 Tax=Arundo donax TaxID=35708 RepID=A0A0A9GHL2_ARUDO